jgi:hypothetical protein
LSESAQISSLSTSETQNKNKKGHQTKEAPERVSEISLVWGRLLNKRRKKQTKKEKTVLSNHKGFVPESGRQANPKSKRFIQNAYKIHALRGLNLFSHPGTN